MPIHGLEYRRAEVVPASAHHYHFRTAASEREVTVNGTPVWVEGVHVPANMTGDHYPPLFRVFLPTACCVLRALLVFHVGGHDPYCLKESRVSAMSASSIIAHLGGHAERVVL